MRDTYRGYWDVLLKVIHHDLIMSTCDSIDLWSYEWGLLLGDAVDGCGYSVFKQFHDCLVILLVASHLIILA